MPSRFGPFDLLNLAGEGSTALVWHARHRRSGINVALKVLKNDFAHDHETRQQFLHEVKCLASLNHPNIIKPLDYGVIDRSESVPDQLVDSLGMPFCVLEYVEQGSLKNQIGRFTWPALRRILLKILDALALAHAHGLIHRDLKPGNVLLGENGPILSDFGIAHQQTDVPQDHSDELSGTPSYMAPEQIKHAWRNFGPWTDIYALGCLAYWACVGHTPFRAQSMMEMFHKHLHQAPPKVRPVFDYPSELVSWIEKCLEKSVDKRHQLAADAACALYEFDGAHLHTAHDGPLQAPSLDALNSTLVSPPLFDRLPASATFDTSLRPIRGEWVHLPSNETDGRIVDIGNGLVPLRSPSLIGRDDERQSLWQLLKDASAGTLQISIIEGPTGIGKTALMNWLAREAHSRGVALPLLMNHDAQALDSNGLNGLLRRTLNCFGLSGKELASHIKERVAIMDYDGPLKDLVLCLEHHAEYEGDAILQSARFETIGRLIQHLCSQRTRILLVDDFQWQNETDAFLSFLARRFAHLPLLIVIGQRPASLDNSLLRPKNQSSAISQVATEVLHLKALSKAEHDSLAQSFLRLHPLAVDALYPLSIGNPLALQTIVKRWSQTRALRSTRDGFMLIEGTDSPIREGQNERWYAQVRSIPITDSCPIRLLEIAACLGRSMSKTEWQDVAHMLQLSFGQAFLNALVERGILEPIQGGRYSFCHAQCQDAFILSAQAENRWILWNAAIADHLEQSADSHSPRRVEHLFSARLYTKAIECVEPAWRVLRREERYEQERRLLIIWLKSLRHLKINRTDIDWCAVKLKWSELAFLSGRNQSAIRHAQAVCSTLEKGPPGEVYIRSLLQLALALKWDIKDSKTNLNRIKRAKDAARVMGNDCLYCECLERLGVYLHTYGYLEDAQKKLEDALRHYESSFGPRLKTSIFLASARLNVDLDNLVLADAHAYLALETVVDEQSSLAASVRLTLGDIARLTHNPDSALDHYLSAINTFQRLGSQELWAGYASLALANFDNELWSLGLANLMSASEAAQQIDNGAAVLMLMTLKLAPCAHMERWEEFDSTLSVLLTQRRHEYAQKDCLDVLKALVVLCRDQGRKSQAHRVDKLYELQRSALGL